MVIGQSLLLVLLGYLGTPSRAILAVTTTSKDLDMKERIDAACPLCDSAGSYILTDFTNSRLYQCPKCGMFEISTRAEKEVKDMLPERREFYGSLAMSAPENKVLEISFEVLPTVNKVNHRYISVR
ncbi:hypothetical protein BSR04_01625 [Serratia plymuthica]|nr:hypothetical protein BSR04_01625 [Serratia plymuthica]